MPTCGALTDSGTECQRRTDGGPCFIHSDGGPPSSHGAPPGNDNAVGNSGGGAPEGNFNAGIHAGFSDWRKHYERLTPDAKAWVDEHAESLITRSKADLTDSEIEAKAREAGTLAHMWRCATADSLKRGWVLESDETHEPTGKSYSVRRLNPALRADLAISRRIRALARELQVYHTPDGLPHHEQ
jgi:hypothetical protein